MNRKSTGTGKSPMCNKNYKDANVATYVTFHPGHCWYQVQGDEDQDMKYNLALNLSLVTLSMTKI